MLRYRGLELRYVNLGGHDSAHNNHSAALNSDPCLWQVPEEKSEAKVDLASCISFLSMITVLCRLLLKQLLHVFFFSSGGRVQSSWLAEKIQHQLLTFTAPPQRSDYSRCQLDFLMPQSCWGLSKRLVDAGLRPARTSECCLASAPCGPWMGLEWQTLFLHFSLSFSPSVLFIVLGRLKPDFCRSSSDGETGRETERGGDRRGRRSWEKGSSQGRQARQEGRRAVAGFSSGRHKGLCPGA